jgi:hypothetical protein
MGKVIKFDWFDLTLKKVINTHNDLKSQVAQLTEDYRLIRMELDIYLGISKQPELRVIRGKQKKISGSEIIYQGQIVKKKSGAIELKDLGKCIDQ